MTWAFIYLACLLVGLVLAAVTGLFGDIRALLQSQPVAPPADHSPALFNFVVRRVAAGLCAFGAAGLILATRGREHVEVTLGGAILAGLAAVVVTMVLLRRRRPPLPRPGTALVVREIPPGGYGQIRLPEHTGGLLLAARSDDPQPIPAGSEVEVVDTARSVVLVRRVGP
ncbi:MAG TPA: hypothetical protein P5234_08590 [Thermoanaerobaculaceae bacterium]|nr:hypothetical protein [Thermoanaerobaculaceae bacterium]HRS16288.1 hypothetical protein [Thermoanaerobaculaceae bacterium]